MINIPAKLGIIAGGGPLPAEIANLHVKQWGGVCIAALEGEADISLIIGHPHRQFPVGSVGGLLDYFTENNIKDIVIIGKINRPDLKSVKVDLAGSRLIGRILKEKFLGDDNILKIIVDFLEQKGFKIIFPGELLKISGYSECYNTNKHPSNEDQRDIQVGKRVLDALGTLDIGQSVIVADGYVLGMEAAEGTDNLIRRCESLRKTSKGGVLVKKAKQGQDLRLDLPTVGPDTAFYLAKHGYKGLTIAAGEVIIVKPEETIQLLNKSGLFLSYI